MMAQERDKITISGPAGPTRLASELCAVTRHLQGALSTGQDNILDAQTMDQAVELNAVIANLMANARMARRKIKDQEARIAELERTATTDELTRVLNRRGFVSEFRRALGRARRHGEEGVLIYLDLDGFKPVNDSFGHAAGDEVLRRVGLILNESVREADSVARIGGDEFCVLLVNTSCYEGIKRAEELNHRLNDAFVHWKGRMIAVRATIGIQGYGQGDEVEKILGCADAAMYRIKQIKESTALSRNRFAGV